MHVSMQIPKKCIKIFIASFHCVIFIFITSLRAHLPYHTIIKCLKKDCILTDTTLSIRSSKQDKKNVKPTSPSGAFQLVRKNKVHSAGKSIMETC